MTKIMNYYKILIIENYVKTTVGANTIRTLKRKIRNVRVQHAEPLRIMALIPNKTKIFNENK
jgi:hypothetical protein